MKLKKSPRCHETFRVLRIDYYHKILPDHRTCSVVVAVPYQLDFLIALSSQTGVQVTLFCTSVEPTLFALFAEK